jgi:hypothetical protein
METVQITAPPDKRPAQAVVLTSLPATNIADLAGQLVLEQASVVTEPAVTLRLIAKTAEPAALPAHLAAFASVGCASTIAPKGSSPAAEIASTPSPAIPIAALAGMPVRVELPLANLAVVVQTTKSTAVETA